MRTAKTTVQIDELSTAAGVADAAQLIALADSTGSKEKAGDTWYTLDKRWNTLKAAWQEGWALTTLFNNMDAATTSAVQIPQAVNDPADQLQAYAMAFARMKADLDLIESMAPAVAAGAKALTDAKTRLADLAKLLTVFNTHIIPYCQGRPSALGAVNNSDPRS